MFTILTYRINTGKPLERPVFQGCVGSVRKFIYECQDRDIITISLLSVHIWRSYRSSVVVLIYNGWRPVSGVPEKGTAQVRL